jgi:cold shock CspA family protein
MRRYKPHYGFVVCDNGEDYSVGSAQLLTSGVQTFYAGDVISFTVGTSRSGRPEAVDVKLIKSAGVE